MDRATWLSIAKSAFMSERSSRAPSRPICRSNSRRHSSWSSISRPRESSALPCRHRSSRAPTRSSSDTARIHALLGGAALKPIAAFAPALTAPRPMIYIINGYQGRNMGVSKWGNSLAIRLPGSVVQALELKDGDEVEVHVAGERAFDIARDRSRQRALERIRAFRKQLPADWKFDREEANAR